MSCNYCWNQPKHYGQYDLYLDGKIKADEFVYRVKNKETGKIETFSVTNEIDTINEKLKTHFTFDTTFKNYADLESAFNNGELQETVIYVIENENVSDDPDSKDKYNEYMVISVVNGDGSTTKKLELIGSGSFAKQNSDLIVEKERAIARENEIEEVYSNITGYSFEKLSDDKLNIDNRIKQEIEDRQVSDATITAIINKEIENRKEEMAKRVSFSLHKNVVVGENIKDVAKLDIPESDNEAMFCPNGLIMGGSAKEAGLVSRGICGVTAPDDNGGCGKENLYINYDGTNTYNSNRQLVLQAGEVGTHYGNNLYQYAAARGDAVKGYVDAVSLTFDEKLNNKVTVNEPITISKTTDEVTTTTSITDSSISTTTITGTLDAESMKNSITAEAIQQVVPMAFGTWSSKPNVSRSDSIAIGSGASADNGGISIGAGTTGYQTDVVVGGSSYGQNNHVTIMGSNSIGSGVYSTNVGYGTRNNGAFSFTAGMGSNSKSSSSITIGSAFTETVDGTDVTHTCTTEGTGSITIGAGANTLNNGDTESSNSVTIGCKASSVASDSVVIGAQSSCSFKWDTPNGNVVIGAGASANSQFDTVIGYQAKSTRGVSVAVGWHASSNNLYATAIGGLTSAHENYTTAIGYGANVTNYRGTAIGSNTKANAKYSTAIGYDASVSDYGATVIRSTAEDGTYTQLYFSGANTPLALKYYPTEWEKKQDVDDQGNPKVDENDEPVMVDDKDKPTKGQAMMGYVVSKVITNEEGKQETKVLECGTNLLAALFPNHGLGDNPFQPTTTAIDGEIVSFHPSDLDMPIEENTTEPEEYQPLPVYPIVEPEIEEI